GTVLVVPRSFGVPQDDVLCRAARPPSRVGLGRHASDGGFEAGEVDGFDEMLDEPGLAGFADVLVVAVAGEGDAAQAVLGAAVTGKVTVKVAPLLAPSLNARIVPPCISTIALQIARPKPRPPNCLVTSRPPCSKGLKMSGRLVGSMPTPVSATVIATPPPG